MKLSDIASALNATLEDGDAETEIIGVAGIEEAVAGHVTFVANPKYAAMAKTTPGRRSSFRGLPCYPRCMLATARIHTWLRAGDRPVLQVSGVRAGNPSDGGYCAGARLARTRILARMLLLTDDVVIGEGAALLPHVVIYRGARIGDNFLAHAHSIVREDCHLG